MYVMDNSTNGSSSSTPQPIAHEPTTALLEYISEMLMEEEEDLGNNPYMLHDVLALQATEKSLHDALHNINLDTTLHHSPSSSGVRKISEMLMEEEEDLGNNPYMLHDVLALQATEKSLHDALHNINLDTTLHHSPSSSGVKKINYRSREDGDMSEHRHKQSANNNNNADDDESEPLEMYDDVLFCPMSSDHTFLTCGQTKAKNNSSHRNEQSKRGPKPKNNKGGGGGNKNDIIDLRSLLMQCAEAVAKGDNKTASDLLLEIRQHSSPKGDGMERTAHYFANALEARLAFNRPDLYAPLDPKRISAVEVLKAYKVFVVACPFKHMSNILANQTIIKVASRATTLHIIDFGILYGFQWPCLIQGLSQRPGGPPKLRITGIDFPQPGFRPTERVADSGRRLAKWADRFGVPFQYNVIAQKWETIRLEDVKVEKNELVVVNCMYRLHNVPDETESGNSPRDVVLNLIKKINPDLFVHGVVHGKYQTPFFVPRFREALCHFLSMFDMFDVTIPRGDKDRLMFEEKIFGKEAINIIACEGTERVERPETYKHWQTRTERAGFKQVPLDEDLLKILSKLKTYYHKSFSVDKDGKWILVGWKGRVVDGFSCWRPTHNRSSS